MPIRASGFHLPSGARAVRADCTGVMNQEEAEAWVRQIDPGGPFSDIPILIDTVGLDRVTPEARALFGRRGDEVMQPHAWMALVVTNPVIRVATNFVMRMSGTRKMRLFANEGEAIRWLDEQLAQMKR